MNVWKVHENKDWKAPGQVHQCSLFQRLHVLLTYNSVTQPHMKELTKLATKEHFVFTLLRLRRNPSLEMLWDIFGITTGTGSRIFITWILFLEKELGFLLPFSTKEELREISKPNCFKKNCFKNLRAIIDCTEFYVGKPGKPSSQSSTYSQYKSLNTFKLLISLSPILHFNFVSKLYSGRISDKEIVNVSGFLEKLNLAML